MYTKKGENIEYTKEVVQEFTLEELEIRKRNLEYKIQRAHDWLNSELAVHQPELDEVNLHIAEAVKLGVTRKISDIEE